MTDTPDIVQRLENSHHYGLREETCVEAGAEIRRLRLVCTDHEEGKHVLEQEITRLQAETDRRTDALEAAMSKHGIRIAVAAERERCAKIADDFSTANEYTLAKGKHDIAAAIRKALDD